MNRATRDLTIIGTSALLLASSVPSAVLATEPDASAEPSGQRVEVPEVGLALTWPEGWRLELEPPMRMEGDPGGDPPDAPFTLLGPDEVGWGSVVFGRPMTEGSNFECSVDLYEAPSLTLEAIVDLHTGLESPGEDLRYTATEVEWHEDVPAGEAVTITMWVEFFGTPTVSTTYWIDGGDDIAMLRCGGGEPVDEQAAAAGSIARTIEFMAGGDERILAEDATE
jgi:hypothetical protein